jgi:hypothetical protein
MFDIRVTSIDLVDERSLDSSIREGKFGRDYSADMASTTCAPEPLLSVCTLLGRLLLLLVLDVLGRGRRNAAVVDGTRSLVDECGPVRSIRQQTQSSSYLSFVP